jgi:hypothetical protein
MQKEIINCGKLCIGSDGIPTQISVVRTKDEKGKEFVFMGAVTNEVAPNFALEFTIEEFRELIIKIQNNVLVEL